MQADHLKLRLKALFFDYLMIVVYLLVLLGISLSLNFFVFESFPVFTETQSHWIAFLTTVLPITIYNAIREMRPPYQTFGKKRVGQKVTYKNSPLMGSVMRNILKFLPWQLAHYAIIKGVNQGNFLQSSVMIPYVLSLTLPIVYILMVALRTDHRHFPDLIGKSQVVNIDEKG